MDAFGNDSISEQLNPAILQLEELMRSEILCPDLLPYARDVLEPLNQSLPEHEATLSESRNTSTQLFTTDIYQLEVVRLKYMIQRYLAARLLKIEALFGSWIVGSTSDDADNVSIDPSIDILLSTEERAFLVGLYRINLSHVSSCVASQLPDKVFDKLRKLDPQESPQTSLSARFVFCSPSRLSSSSSSSSSRGISLGDGTRLGPSCTDVALVKYSELKDQIANLSVRVI